MLDITVLVTLLLFCVSHIPFRREGELLVCKRVIPVVIPLCNRNRNYLFQLGTKNVNRWMCQMDSSLEYDYPGIDYPIPFNEVFNNVSMRYHDFGCVTCSPPFVNRGLIQPHSKGMDPYLFITGASDNHAAGSVNCLLSIALNYPNSSLLYVSFGSDRMTPLIMRLLSSIHFMKELAPVQRSTIVSMTFPIFPIGCTSITSPPLEVAIHGRSYPCMMHSLNGVAP